MATRANGLRNRAPNEGRAHDRQDRDFRLWPGRTRDRGAALAEGREVIVAQRNAPSDLPKGATFAPADALDRDAVVKAVRGSGQFVVAIGFPYSGVVWREVWPKAIANFVAACKATGARMVFIDNLYMYGPQTTPLVETMPLSDYRSEACGALSRDPGLDGRGGRRRSARGGAARARLLWAWRRSFLFSATLR